MSSQPKRRPPERSARVRKIVQPAVLTKLDLEYNLGEAGKKAVRDAVKDRSGFVLEL